MASADELDLRADEDSTDDDDFPNDLETQIGFYPKNDIPGATEIEVAKVTTTEREKEHVQIFQRWFGNNRPPRYDDVQAEAEEGRVNWPRPPPHSPTDSGAPTSHNTNVLEIMHNWTEEVEEGHFVANINTIQQSRAETRQAQGHPVWLHVTDSRPSLGKLSDIFQQHLASRVPSYVSEMIPSLLKRVETVREKRFVDGKYLVTRPVRYDGKSTYFDDEDHPCTFLNFPYLAVGDFEHDTSTTAPSGNGDATLTTQDERYSRAREHPVRTLFQSRYRLESTRERDKNQSITSLTNQAVQECIKPPIIDVARADRRWKKKLYVPQLWSLSISGDIMITNGPIQEKDLRASSLRVKEMPAHTGSTPLVVRFDVEYVTDKIEFFLYPANRCAWYFGLLNKKRKVLTTLGEKSPRSQGKRADAGTTPKFRLYYTDAMGDDVQITADNWVDLLNSQSSEQIVVTMKREQKVSVNEIPPDDPAIPQIQVPLLEPPELRHSSHSPGRSSAASHSTQPRLQNFDSFLEWPFRDDKQRSESDRVLLWMDNIFRKASQTHRQQLGPDLATPKPVPHHGRAASRAPSILVITGSRFEDVQKELFPGRDGSPVIPTSASPGAADPSQHSPATPAHNNQASPVGHAVQHGIRVGTPDSALSKTPPSNHFVFEVKILLQHARTLLKCFIPEGLQCQSKGRVLLTSDHNLVRLYWGLVEHILWSVKANRYAPAEVDKLRTYIDDLIVLAEALHKGVRKRRDPGEDKADDNNDDDGSTSRLVNDASAVIQAPIPKSLEHIIAFLFRVANYRRPDSSAIANSSVGSVPNSTVAFDRWVGPEFKEARSAFISAQNMLITAADENAFQRSLGPVVTPEAITILLLERLSRGVYEDRTIDITDIYERVVEKLASKVERHPSRHLLLEIQHVCEEIEIILDVLQQQRRFLDAYKAYLDPNTFEKASTKRHARFPYERRAIDRLANEIGERISDFTELKRRGDLLGDQNVKLVESYQEDNSGILMIFTLVTIIFLPFSAVTGFFGMNVIGISNTAYTVKHVWLIAVLFTVGVVGISILLIQYGFRFNRFYLELRDRRRDAKQKKRQ